MRVYCGLVGRASAERKSTYTRIVQTFQPVIFQPVELRTPATPQIFTEAQRYANLEYNLPPSSANEKLQHAQIIRNTLKQEEREEQKGGKVSLFLRRTRTIS